MDKLLIMNFINLINYRIMTIAHCVTNIITKKKKDNTSNNKNYDNNNTTSSKN